MSCDDFFRMTMDFVPLYFLVITALFVESGVSIHLFEP